MRNTPQSDVEESSPNGGLDPAPGEAAAPSRTDDSAPSPEQGNEDADAGAQVMGRLPRTRPQRRSGRRPAGAAKATPATTPKRKPATRRGQGAKSAAGARAATSSAAKTRPAGGQAARRRTPETATRDRRAQARSRDCRACGRSSRWSSKTAPQGHGHDHQPRNEADRARTSSALKKLLAPDEATALVVQHARPLSSEPVPLRDALERTLAVDVASLDDVPGFDNSAMDGFAVRSHDTASAGEGQPRFIEDRRRVARGHAGDDVTFVGTGDSDLDRRGATRRRRLDRADRGLP